MMRGPLALLAVAFATIPTSAVAASSVPSFTVSPTPVTSSAASIEPSFKVTPSEKPAGSELNSLSGVAAISASDAVAVGDTRSSKSASTFRALIEQFDGKEWKSVNSASVTATDTTFLGGVAATGEKNVWAVGSDRKAGPETKSESLIEHFNGKEWTRVASPAGEPPAAALNGVSADSETDAWAVGESHSPNPHEGAIETLIEHFNGKEWSVVPGATGPFPDARENRLVSVDALSPSNVFADGFSGDGDPLAEHFNGKEWSVADLPVLRASGRLRSISASSSTDVWAVGFANGEPLAFHFNGVEWSVVATPTLPGTKPAGNLDGVLDLSPTNVWAVGFSESEGVPHKPLIEHFNGSSWSIVQSPSIATASALAGVAGLGEGPELAIGVQEGEKAPLTVQN
jgi:hypothetical protein